MLSQIRLKEDMPRGELENYILLCSYRDKDGVLHGIGLRKAYDGPVRIVIAPAPTSSFSEVDGATLVISDDVEESRTIRVDPELCGITTSDKLLHTFKDYEHVKNAISLLLQYSLEYTLYTYHGLCIINVEGDDKTRPAFVFRSQTGKYTGLPLTSSSIYASASVYVNYIEPNLHSRSYWRATCFEPLITVPRILKWAKKDIDVKVLRNVAEACVLTFNSLNCDDVSSSRGECDTDGVYQSVMDAIPCPYDRRL